MPVFGGQDGHALTVAPTGRGKGTCSIIPNLLRQRFMVLIDPGGENTAVAIKSWRESDYDVQVLNPWGMHGQAPWMLPQHRFNPLSILDRGRNELVRAVYSYDVGARRCALQVHGRRARERISCVHVEHFPPILDSR